MNRRRWIAAGAGAFVLLIVGGCVAYIVFRGDAPAEVDLATANAQLDADLAAPTTSTTAAPVDDANNDSPTTSSSTTAAPTTTRAPFDGVVDGTWVIDNEIGEFDFESASGSFAGFRVEEQLGEVKVIDVTAVGRTGDVTGELVIEAGVLTAASITVDMTTIVSNDHRRDSEIAYAVGTRDFPTATFALTDAVELPPGLADGEQITVDAVGELTIKETTNVATFRIDALIRANDAFGVVVGTTDIVFAEYGVEVPTSPVVFSLDEFGIVEFQLIVDRR